MSPLATWKAEEELRVLDIDTEALPGHWIGGDYVSKVITAAAWSWIGEKRVEVATHYDVDPSRIAQLLAMEMKAADIVVGHFIRGYDLRLINGALLMGGFEPLGRIMTHDTKLDMKNVGGRSSSQKNLAAQLGLKHPKVEVTLPDWEGFNMRRDGFKQKGIDRVRGDVIQNKELYSALIEAGWLGAPTIWTPKSFGGRYHA